jgi:hypothetical protein
LLKFFGGVGITLLKKEDAAEFVMHDSIAWKLR